MLGTHLIVLPDKRHQLSSYSYSSRPYQQLLYPADILHDLLTELAGDHYRTHRRGTGRSSYSEKGLHENSFIQPKTQVILATGRQEIHLRSGHSHSNEGTQQPSAPPENPTCPQ